MQKGKPEFKGFEEGKTMVKMKKPRKSNALLANWEGPYVFMKYKDKKGCKEFDDNNLICIIKGIDGKQWECARRDLKMLKSKYFEICVDTDKSRKEVSHV